MKTLALILLPLLAVCPATAQDKPWQKLSDPTAAEIAANFSTPPPVYSSQVACGLGANPTAEAVGRGLDKLLAMNIHVAYIMPGASTSAHYLDPGYFDAVKVVVAEAKKRGMYLWFDDEGGYPTGFAGGKFTLERPDLTMKALSSYERVAVNGGQTFSRQLDDKTICVTAYNTDTGAAQILEPQNGQINWTAPVGNWTVALPHWAYKSGPTRSANNGTGAKDNTHALMDFLDPAADQQFLQWVFDPYQQAAGDDLGKTLLGFRGDEPAFGFNPWTPNFPAEFQKRKGYDIRPYLPAISAITIGGRGGAQPANLDVAHRAYADYCDVWSDLFGQNFFGAEAKWCADHGMEMQMHIEHEEILPQLANADGDFFKCMTVMQVPGIDVIWHQVWHDVTADFPKLASSAAHLGGHPQAMSESFAAMSGNYPTPNLGEAKWILDHQMVLGVNHFEYMSMGLTGGGGGGANAVPAPADAPMPDMTPGAATGNYRYLTDPFFPRVVAYVNRITYVLAQGRPAAQIGVYIPSSSFWFNDNQANTDFLDIVHQLLQHQRDVDFVDDGALSTTLKREGNSLINASGQAYRAIIVPRMDAISQAALDKLRAFAQAGGKVVFLGHAPKLVVDKTFISATGPADISWAIFQDQVEVTPDLLAKLPAPDVAVDQPSPWLKYNHRRLKDADVYFFFNEGGNPLDLKATVDAYLAPQPAYVNLPARYAQVWDGMTGKIEPLPGTVFASGKCVLPLKLGPWETKLIVVYTNPPPATKATSAN
ncbi:MAG TPA: glycosyl hydrolase [Opitutales bacterium]|nr:glycosyl hydrolase [Opitutales bacterium]